MKSKIAFTESDVYEANKGLVQRVCQVCGRNIEHEDRESIASLGMLYAIRTYMKGVAPFKQYAIDCMQELLQLEEHNQRRIERVEHPISLDMRLKCGESPITYVETFPSPNDDVTSTVITLDFMKHLNKDLQHIAQLLRNDYTDKEIGETMNIPKNKVKFLKMALISRWEEYDKFNSL